MSLFEKLFNKPKTEKEPEDDQSLHENINEFTEKLENDENDESKDDSGKESTAEQLDQEKK